MSRVSYAAGCIAAALLGGCSLAPKYRPPPPPQVSSYKEAGDWMPAAPADAQPRGRWWEGPATKYRYTVKVRGGQRVASDRYVARVRLTGNFPGRTVDLRYRFTLRDALISALKIAP